MIKPLALCLQDPQESPIPEAQFVKALDVVESWMVRRMLVRATTKNYNRVVAEMVAQVRTSDRTKAGDVIESYLAGQSSGSRYWPDDAEVREELATLLAYRRRVGDVGENVAVAGSIRLPSNRVAAARAFRPDDARSCIGIASATVFLSIRGESRSAGPGDLDNRLEGPHVRDDRRVIAPKS